MRCSIWACFAALLSREFGLPALALTLGLLVVLHWQQGCWTPALIALPAALGALQLPPQHDELNPTAGLVSFSARVEPGIRRDLRAGTRLVPLRWQGRQAILVLEGELRILPGDRLRGTAFLAAAPRHARRSFRLRLKAHAAGLQVRPGGWSMQRQAEAARLALQSSLLALIPGEEGRLLCHLVLGRGPALPRDLVSAHRRTGLTHLLAVSGAHASMLAWMMGLFFRLCTGRGAWTSRGYRRCAASLLMIYGAITGWEPPVFRALAAFSLMLIATARGRRLSIHACLAFPALLTALLQPDELFGPSFCLSYAAVIGLSLSGAFRSMNPWQQWLALPLRASFWAVICTAPLTLIYFGQVAPWTLIATPLLGPLVGLMLGLGVLTAILGLSGPGLASIPAAGLGAITSLYDSMVRAFAELPGAPVFASCSAPIGLLMGCGIFGLLGLLMYRDRRGVLVLCLSLCLPQFIPGLPGEQASLRLLAVGHGQACLINSESGRQILVDCGSLGNPERAGLAVAAALRRRRIDLLVLSHGDQDHSGGIPALIDRVPIERAILPTGMAGGAIERLLQAAGTKVRRLAPGQVWAEEDLLILAPESESPGSNDASLWLRADIGELRCLLPGDAGSAGIHAFRKLLPEARADIFLLPHHGRGDRAVLEDLLRKLQPDLALVSNRSSEWSTSLGRLAGTMGIRVLHTSLRGDITVRGKRGAPIDCEYPARLETSPR